MEDKFNKQNKGRKKTKGKKRRSLKNQSRKYFIHVIPEREYRRNF